jgi:NADH dehydrogenase (ubiquinone) 1 alpha/beta subcomplex 1
MLIRQSAAKLITKTLGRPVLSRAFSGPNGIPTLKPFPRDEGHGYYLDPEEVSKRLMRVIAMHPGVKRPDELTLSKSWTALGIDDLARVEIFLEIEREFEIEFSDQDVERFKNIHEAVEHVAKSFFAR